MQNLFNALTLAFRKHKGYLTSTHYRSIVKKYSKVYEGFDTIYLLLQAAGYPIELEGGEYKLLTFFTPYEEQRFCVIDIETNGSKPGTSQVIELGAVMVQNGQIIDRLETFVECAYLPESITKITGITPQDLIGAPSRKEALTKLRLFMDDAIFVAHNVKFDHTFLNASFTRFGLGEIGNPTLCTIDLAKRTFESERYGLAHLREFLAIDTPTHHRAYADALSALAVMQKSFENLPEYVNTTDELIAFSQSSRKERSKKKPKPDQQTL
jgi:DNA polymerase-3 subunit epsilon